MARIADGELERIKREVSLVRLIEGQGHRLVSQGKDLACRCPWHEGDETPSCIVTPKSNLWHCFGCDAGGTVIDWVMRSHRVSFRHACELLLKEHPALGAAPSSPADGSTGAPPGAGAAGRLSQGKLRQAQSFSVVPSADQVANDQRLLEQVIAFYHETLMASPEALKYLDGRGLGNRELIERFRLGFANRTLAYRLAPKAYKAGAELRTALQRLGILRDSGHEHFNGSIVIPLWCPADGNLTDGHLSDSPRHVVGAYGRKINDNLRAGTPKHLYLPGPHRGVLNAEGLEGQREVILCEALLDALTFWAAGYRNVTSCYGANGLTEEIVVALKACGAQRVLVAFDRDEAGDRGAEVVAQRLMADGLECYRLLFPKGMDANAYASSVKLPEKSLGVVIRAAQWMGRGIKPVSATKPVAHPVPTDNPHLVREAEPAVVSLASSAALESPSPSLPIVPDPAPPMSTSLAAQTNIVGDAAEIGTAEGGAAKEDMPAVVILDTEPMLPEPEAAAVPAGPPPAPEAKADEQQLVIVFGERRYRVRGLPKQLGEALKVNVLVTCSRGDESNPVPAAEAGLHVDTLDLYQAKARAVYAKCAAGELGLEEGVVQHDLGRLLLSLEQVIDERAKAAEAPSVAPLPAMSAEESTEALAFLRDEKLIERIAGDFERVGLVGEPSNALVAYLACVSRKLASPLAVLIQSTSAAGKSTLMDAVLALVPEEDRVHYSAMTGQSLFYLGEQEIKHKILAIAEEEGVRQAAYALKVLQSQGELTIASTGKDPATGMLVTQQYRVEGPVMLFLTTTAIDVDEELTNRCLVLTINESREQTRAIQARQRSRRTLEGLLAQSEAEAIQRLHRNAQRLLRPLAVVNPYAEQLTFLDDRTRTRRDHAKYLTLIETIALLHQHQRALKTVKRAGRVIEYIEVTLEDIALANALAHEVLGRSLDELPPQTRRVLGVIEAMVEGECRERSITRADARFTRRALRRRCGMSDTAVRVHLERLIAQEYVRPVAGRNGARFEYELLFDGDLDASAPQMIGLIDIAALQAAHALRPDSLTTIATSQGEIPDLAPPLQAACTPLAGTSQGAVLAENQNGNTPLGRSRHVDSENALLGDATRDRRSSNHSVDGHLIAADPAPALSSSLAAVFSSER